MSEFELEDGLYASVTSAGAYHACGRGEGGPGRDLLLGLLSEPATPRLDVGHLREWAGLQNDDQALALLHHVQQAHWVEGLPQAREAPRLRLERDAPALLEQLSDSRCALLADGDGLQLAVAGFTHEAAEQTAAWAAELAGVLERYDGLLRGNLRLRAGGLAAVDAAGNSQLGLWPLRVRNETFLLVIGGAPLLNRRAFADLVWGLVKRYAER